VILAFASRSGDVYWKPDDEALKALGSLFGLMEGRTWIEWLYATHR
jgi:hypothetical protein